MPINYSEALDIFANSQINGSEVSMDRSDHDDLETFVKEQQSTIWQLEQRLKAFTPYETERHITQIEHYISKNGNLTWRGLDNNGATIYFRQSHKDLLIEAGIWSTLNLMEVGETIPVTLCVYTIPDGDFHKPVRFGVGGIVLLQDSVYEPPEPPRWDSTAHYVEDMNKAPDDIYAAQPVDPFIALVRSGNFVILDTETTGLGSDAEICQIAIIDSSGNVLLDTLVKPQRPIPYQATAIHHITNDMVKDATHWLNINEQVWQLIHDKTVIVYNAEYDFRLMAQSEQACEPLATSDWHTIQRECAMLKFAEIYGDWNSYHGNYKWQPLDRAAHYYKLPVNAAHTALGDCLTTLAVCKAMAAQ